MAAVGAAGYADDGFGVVAPSDPVFVLSGDDVVVAAHDIEVVALEDGAVGDVTDVGFCFLRGHDCCFLTVYVSPSVHRRWFANVVVSRSHVEGEGLYVVEIALCPLCPSDISPASGGNPAAPTVFFAHCGTSPRRAVTPCGSLRFPRPAFGCLGFAKGTFRASPMLREGEVCTSGMGWR